MYRCGLQSRWICSASKVLLKRVWQSIQKSSIWQYSVSAELKDGVDPVIQCNAYFTHPEIIRKLNMRRILNVRSKKYWIRKLATLKFYFDSKKYIDLIDWQNTHVTEPPLLEDMSRDRRDGNVSGKWWDTRGRFSSIPLLLSGCWMDSETGDQTIVCVCGKKARDGFNRIRMGVPQTVASPSWGSERACLPWEKKFWGEKEIWAILFMANWLFEYK